MSLHQAQLRTPVLFLVFNRPNPTQKVFNAIRGVRPKYLFLASDGCRNNNHDDRLKNSQVKDIIKNVDWDCEVKTLFRDYNLGCKQAVSQAITWFFNHVDQGIIIEDDCLPSNSFFYFCESLLDKYKFNERIGQISGFNGLGSYQKDACSYHFSNFGSIWGWATWKRAWDSYDVDMKGYPHIKDADYLRNIINDKEELKNRIKAFDQTYNGLIDTWDYQWIFCRLVNRYLIILPYKNLVQNIGFNSDATHTKFDNSNFSSLNSYEINFPLVHPSHYCPDLNFELRLKRAKKLTLMQKIRNKLTNFFN